MKLLLIDGSNLIFRAYYASEKRDIRNKNNEPVNAVYTLISMIDKMLKEENPTHVFIALDNGKSTFRHEMYEEYKGKRVQTPEQLKGQFPIIKEYFAALGISYGAMDEYEADDLIATYAKQGAEQGYDVKVISGDKDLLQLVDDKITVLTPKMGFAKECSYTPKVFEEKYEFTPKRFIEYKALVGDSSDNIIGIEKLGDKTAKKFIKQSANLEELIQNAKDSTSKSKVIQNLIANETRIHTNLKLVTLINNIEVEQSLEALAFNNYNEATYSKFLKDQGFIKIYNEFLKTINKEIMEEKLEYEVIKNFNIKQHTGSITTIYTQSLTENYLISENLGIGIVSEKGNFYITLADINEEFKSFLQNESKKVFYNLKQLMVTLKANHIKGIKTDVYLALSLLNSSNYKKDMADIFITYNIYNVKLIEEVYKSKHHPQKPQDLMTIEADIINKTQAISQIFEKVNEQIQGEGLEPVLFDIEIPLTKVLAKVEQNGIYVNQQELQNLKKEYQQKIKTKEEELSLMTEINFNSTKQLADLLFQTWELPKKGLKKTTTGISTDINNLEKLINVLQENIEEYEQEIAFITNILEYRKLTKIHKTYLTNIASFILQDQRIHPINHQLLAETGRLSVTDPNIQNMPIKSKEGQKIRNLFQAPQEKAIIALDYSQIELRIMAFLAQDDNMLQAFNEDKDIHEQTAKNIFNLTEVTKEKRANAKAINFGIIYGMSAYGLAKQVGITTEEAKDFIEKYFEKYPKVYEYMEEQKKIALENGFVKTIFSRKRKIENIHSKNFREKEHAQRAAINTPIQGSAADIMKLALIKVQEIIDLNNLEAKIIMQIHDEIVLEINKSQSDKIIGFVKKAMEEAILLPVKLKVEGSVGQSWLDAK
ncbi:MAG: DNA polymerase I [Mycoplasmatales bacterium]